MPVIKKGSSISSASPVYLQACSVCKAEFSKRRDWLNHLTQDKHQKLAREECLNTWDSDSRDSCLIIYTSTALTKRNAREILECFSGPNNNCDCLTMVTDFIWWEDRPKIGILQFESREKAKRILKTFGYRNSQKIQIGDFQYVQVKSGSKLKELEWDAIRPQVETNSNGIPPNKKLKLDKSVCQETDNLNSSHATKSLSIANPEKSPLFPITEKSHPLQFEYWTIQNSIHFPENPKNRSLMETQVCRLLQYLCQFDPRTKPLINLATYWLALNSITISGDIDSKNPMELPSHFTTQWLVLFYLCNKSYIPTPREVLINTKSSNVLTDEVSGTNLYFHCDPAFVEKWKLRKGKILDLMKKMNEEFIFNLFQLFRDFLNYCANTLGGMGKVINTKDGKAIGVAALLKTDELNMLSSKKLSKWQNVMSREEIDMLKMAVIKEKSSEEFVGLHMTNPFLFGENISLAKDIKRTLRNFGVGSAKIAKFLSDVKKIGVEDSLHKIGGLKSLMTIVKKD